MSAPKSQSLQHAKQQALARPRVGVMHRLARGIAKYWIAHVTLIVMAAVFVFPFVWMIGMSLKTDEEATSTTTFPEVPTFREASPFVRRTAAVDRPPLASAGRWASVYPMLLADAEHVLASAALPIGTPSDQADALRKAAAIEIVRQQIGRMDESLWESNASDETLRTAFAEGLNAQSEQAALQDRLGRLDLGGILVRTLTGHVAPVAVKGALWTVVSGNAKLIRTASGEQIVQYRFENSSAEPVVLRADFDTGVLAKDLHRLVVSYKGDASWHHLDADLKLGPAHFVSDQTTYVAQHRPASLLLQPPTFQDETLTPHNWVPLVPMESTPGANAATHATLTLTLRPSSTVRAIWGKVERNYERAFRSVPFWTYVANSVILVVLQMAGALFSSGFVGYAFARLNWPGRSLAMGLLLSTMMLPGQVTMIPSFLIWRALGWYNTLNPLWVGAWLGNAFFIFLMVQHMRTIPKELDEAARIDGMNALQTWWYVIMPQVKPTLASIAILTFMGAWNEFMGPLIMLRDQSKFPLSLGLFSMRLDAGTDWPLIMAGNLMMTLPVIVIFFIFQRYFIEGVTVTGMKG